MEMVHLHMWRLSFQQLILPVWANFSLKVNSIWFGSIKTWNEEIEMRLVQIFAEHTNNLNFRNT